MASEEITNETAEKPVEAAAPAPAAETPAAAVSAPEEVKKPEPRKDIFAELGLGGDDDKPKILKAKGSKNVSSGVVHVSSTFNNTVVTVTDQRGNVIGCSSVLAKRSVLLEFPMEKDECHEDYLDWLRILKKYGTACGVDEPLLKYRLSSTGKSGNKLHSAGMTYRVYRELGMGTFRSLYCFACYAVNGVRKYYGKGKKRGRD